MIDIALFFGACFLGLTITLIVLKIIDILMQKRLDKIDKLTQQ
jgi:hypothetical protein